MKSGRVLKPALLASLTGNVQSHVNYVTRNYGKTVPCNITFGAIGNEYPPEGHVWILLPKQLDDTFQNTMRFHISKDKVLVRHKFIRPWISISSYEKFLDTEKQMIEESHNNSEAYKKWREENESTQ